MEIEKENIIKYFDRLDDDVQSKFLTSFMFYLTLIGRSAYHESHQDLDSNIVILGKINELLHRSLSQVNRLMFSKKTGYPNTVYWNIVFDEIEDDEFRKKIFWAVEKAKSSLN